MGLNAFKIILSIRGFFSTNIYMSFCLIWKHNIDNAINKQMLQEVQKQSYLQECVPRFLFIVKTSKLDMTISLLIIDIIHIKFYGYIESKIHVW